MTFATQVAYGFCFGAGLILVEFVFKSLWHIGICG